MANLFTSRQGLLAMDHKISMSVSLYNGLFSRNVFLILRNFMKALEWTGHGVPWIIYALWGLWKTYPFLSTTRAVSAGGADSDIPNILAEMQMKVHFTMYVYMMLGLTLDLIVIATLKLSVKRQRPFYNEGDLPLSASKIDSFSFPSGHATRAFMLYILLSEIKFVSSSNSVWMRFWALLLGYSRVALGRHYLSDVVIGSTVGVFEGWLTLYLGSFLV